MSFSQLADQMTLYTLHMPGIVVWHMEIFLLDYQHKFKYLQAL
jgi:hypothetical protein